MSSEKKTISSIVKTDSVKLHFKDYCRSTSIHGIKYLGEENRPTGERICWIILFITCLSLNAYLINQVWKKWNDSPVIVSFAEMTTPVWNVPFPAVTICSEVKSRATLFNFTKQMENNATEDDNTGYVSLLCDDNIQCDGSDYVNDTAMDFLMEVAPPFLDTIFLCKWKKYVSQDCSNIFTRIVTDEGVCYSFNMLDIEDLFREDVLTYFESDNLTADGWTLDQGYLPDSSLDSYPNRALQSGHSGGLFTVLKADRRDADFYCKGPVQGFKILLHNPAEFPLVRDRYLKVPLNQEVMVVVQPNIMTTSENLKSYKPHERNCFFPSERYLSYFKVYTQPNCELECLTNYTRRECGCVALHMPRKQGTEVCGPRKKACMVEAAHKLRMSEISSAYKSETMGSCDCLPACTSIGYNGESSQADFDFHSVLKAYGDNMTEYEYDDASRLTIFFKDVQFTTSRRNELFGTADFLASCGGLLGLFCGVSFLSIVELLYYTTLRIWNNISAIKKANKKNEILEGTSDAKIE